MSENPYKVMEPWKMARLMQEFGKTLEIDGGCMYYDKDECAPFRFKNLDVDRSSPILKGWTQPCRVKIEKEPRKPKTETRWQWLLKNKDSGYCKATTCYYKDTESVFKKNGCNWEVAGKILQSEREFIVK